MSQQLKALSMNILQKEPQIVEEPYEPCLSDIGGYSKFLSGAIKSEGLNHPLCGLCGLIKPGFMFISKILITTEPTEPTENTEGLVHPALLIVPILSISLFLSHQMC